jgi:hypothetical protein
MPSALAGTRSPVCSEESTLVVTAGQPRHRHSLRDGVNAYLRALPGVRDLIVTVANGSSPARLAPAQGRQDHTISPSASRIARHTIRPRPSHPAPNTRDDREAPLAGTGYRERIILLRKTEAQSFCDRSENPNKLKRLSNFDFSRRRSGGSLAIARGSAVKKFTCRANQQPLFHLSPRAGRGRSRSAAEASGEGESPQTEIAESPPHPDRI